MAVRRVEVEIQELVLHGFSRADGAALAASIGRELGTRLAHAGHEFGETLHVERVDPRRVAAGADTSALGAAVADRVRGSLRP